MEKQTLLPLISWEFRKFSAHYMKIIPFLEKFSKDCLIFSHPFNGGWKGFVGIVAFTIVFLSLATLLGKKYLKYACEFIPDRVDKNRIPEASLEDFFSVASFSVNVLLLSWMESNLRKTISCDADWLVGTILLLEVIIRQTSAVVGPALNFFKMHFLKSYPSNLWTTRWTGMSFTLESTVVSR